MQPIMMRGNNNPHMLQPVGHNNFQPGMQLMGYNNFQPGMQPMQKYLFPPPQSINQQNQKYGPPPVQPIVNQQTMAQYFEITNHFSWMVRNAMLWSRCLIFESTHTSTYGFIIHIFYSS